MPDPLHVTEKYVYRRDVGFVVVVVVLGGRSVLLCFVFCLIFNKKNIPRKKTKTRTNRNRTLKSISIK